MATTLLRSAYADMYGPTTGDRVRLADTDLQLALAGTSPGTVEAASSAAAPTPTNTASH